MNPPPTPPATTAAATQPASAPPPPETAPPPTAPPVVAKPDPLPVPKTPDVVPPKPVPAPTVKVGSLDATPVIASLDVTGPLPSSVVRRAVERVLPALRTCYRAAAKASKSTPPVTLSLSFEVDESSSATSVSAGASFGTLSSCAKSAIGRVQTQTAPDVGTVHVAASISFKPTP